MNIAIWGMGVSGLSTLKYLKTKTNHRVYAIDKGEVCHWKNQVEVLAFLKEEFCLNQDELEHIGEKFDFIILSPGISKKQKCFDQFKEVPIICEVEFTFNLIKLPVIAVTGTNGKTSTVTMLKMALELSNKKVFLGGNIGLPFCEILMSEEKYDFAVLELSSFQLELMDNFRPFISVILNMTPSHMERYDSFDDYRLAKFQIAKNQKSNDHCILDSNLMKLETSAHKIEIDKLSHLDFTRSKLVGEHYKSNLDVVDKILGLLKIENKSQIIQEIIDKFPGVKYRLEFLHEHKSVLFYNDAKSTNIEATISALSSFLEKKVLLILGGKLRSGSQNLEKLKEFKNIYKIYAFGQAKEDIFDQLSDVFEVSRFSSLSSVIADVDLIEGGVVLLSPAYPSFDQYRDYNERGEHFKSLVKSSF